MYILAVNVLMAAEFTRFAHISLSRAVSNLDEKIESILASRRRAAKYS